MSINSVAHAIKIVDCLTVIALVAGSHFPPDSLIPMQIYEAGGIKSGYLRRAQEH